jgi:hypothetical protein
MASSEQSITDMEGWGVAWALIGCVGAIIFAVAAYRAGMVTDRYGEQEFSASLGFWFNAWLAVASVLGGFWWLALCQAIANVLREAVSQRPKVAIQVSLPQVKQ